MKAIRNGLVAAAFATTLSGCGEKSLNELENTPFPTEEAYIGDLSVDDFVDGNTTNASVILSSNGYSINLDENRYFHHSNRQVPVHVWVWYGDEPFDGVYNCLVWDGVSYIDDNLDGDIDLMSANHIRTEISEQANNFYDNQIEKLRVSRVERIWNERWR